MQIRRLGSDTYAFVVTGNEFRLLLGIVLALPSVLEEWEFPSMAGFRFNKAMAMARQFQAEGVRLGFPDERALMIAELQEIFRSSDPEIVLERYNVNHEAVLLLLDCDGYKLGRIVCEGVYALCITTRSQTFSAVSVFYDSDLDPRFSWLAAGIPEDFQVAVFEEEADPRVESSLPVFDGARFGYVICKTIDCQKELGPER